MDDGTPAREIAVLFRTNAQSVAYEQALATVHVPCAVRGSERFFERPEVRQAVGVLRASIRSTDPGLPTGMPDAAHYVLSAVGWSAEPPTERGAVRDRWESLAAVAAFADEFAASRPD